MAKNFPYFKFTASRWLTGDIVFEPLEVQGLFINLCAIYWERDGKLSIEDINKRYKKPTALQLLIGRFISVKDDFISIKFIDEQFFEVSKISLKNSKNGKKGGRPKSNTTKGKKPTQNPPLTQINPPPSKGEKKRKEKNIYSEKELAGVKWVIDFLNKTTGKKYLTTNKAANELIVARMRENRTSSDFTHVITVKTQEWKGTDMEKFLRPSTLFNAEKFESYANQSAQKLPKEKITKVPGYSPGDTISN